MPAAGAVSRDEVQVITRHIQGLRVLRSPEAHEGPRDIAKFELRLNGRRLNQRNSFFRAAHRSRVDIVECSIDSQSEKEVVRLAQGVEVRSQVGQVGAILQGDCLIQRKGGDCRERTENVVLYFSHRAVRAHLKEVPVHDDHLTIQTLEGAYAQITVL